MSSSVIKNAFIIARTTRSLKAATSTYLCSASSFADVIPSETVSITEEQQRGKRCRFLLILSLAPGYSKLQIAADNIARYWNMFDLLTHTTAPPSFSTSSSSSSPSSYSKNRGRHGAPVTKLVLWKLLGRDGRRATERMLNMQKGRSKQM